MNYIWLEWSGVDKQEKDIGQGNLGAKNWIEKATKSWKLKYAAQFSSFIAS